MFADNEKLKSQLAQHEDNKSKEVRMEEFESQLKQSDVAQRNLKKLLVVSIYYYSVIIKLNFSPSFIEQGR